MAAKMITSVADGAPAPLAAEGGAAGTGPGRPSAARARLGDRAPGARSEEMGRSQRTLTLVGNIDVTTDEAVRDRAAQCLRDQPDVLIVDLRELNFCDSTGVRALRWVLRRAALVGATVRIIPPGEHVCRELALLGASDLLAAINSASRARASHQFRLSAGPLTLPDLGEKRGLTESSRSTRSSGQSSKPTVTSAPSNSQVPSVASGPVLPRSAIRQPSSAQNALLQAPPLKAGA